jgi:hypothetical protein
LPSFPPSPFPSVTAYCGAYCGADLAHAYIGGPNDEDPYLGGTRDDSADKTTDR